MMLSVHQGLALVVVGIPVLELLLFQSVNLRYIHLLLKTLDLQDVGYNGIYVDMEQHMRKLEHRLMYTLMAVVQRQFGIVDTTN